MPSELLVRPATRADIEAIYPDETASFRAWVVEVDGETGGVIGMALSRPACIFSVIHDSLRPHLRKMTVMRLVHKFKGILDQRGLPVVAICDPDEEESPNLLRKLGFEPFGQVGGDYVWRRG